MGVGLLFLLRVSWCWSNLYERTSKHGGVVGAESVFILDNFCNVCSHGVAGGDGKSIANEMKEERRKVKQGKASNFMLALAHKVIAKFELFHVHNCSLRGAHFAFTLPPYVNK